MGDRNDGEPHREAVKNEDQDAGVIMRGLVTRQRQVANVLQQLTTTIQHIIVPRGHNQNQEENSSVAGRLRARVTPTHTYDRPTHPKSLRNEPEEEDMAEEEDEVAFTVNVTTLHDEWDALPSRVKEHLNFDRFMSQKREHNKKWNWNDRKP